MEQPTLVLAYLIIINRHIINNDNYKPMISINFSNISMIAYIVHQKKGLCTINSYFKLIQFFYYIKACIVYVIYVANSNNRA